MGINIPLLSINHWDALGVLHNVNQHIKNKK